MIERLDDYDWQQVFAIAGDPAGGENPPSVTVVPPGIREVPETHFSRDDVEKVVWIEDGENESLDWLIGGTLKDGRWFFIAAGCDYTGWDCQSGGRAWVAASRANIERYAMGERERERLGVQIDGEARKDSSGW